MGPNGLYSKLIYHVGMVYEVGLPLVGSLLCISVFW